MKTQSMFLTCCIGLIMLLTSCQPDDIQTLRSSSSGPPPEPGSSILSSSCDLSIHLDLETISYSRPKDDIPSEELHSLDRVAGIPVVQRLDIQVCSSLEGEGEWFIQSLEPEVEFPTNHEPRPDDTPEFSHAYISNNEMHVIDTEGEIIEGGAIELPGLHELISLAPGSREMIWEQALIQAKEQGIVLAEVEEDFIDIKIEDPETGEESVMMLDLAEKVLTGTAVFDAQGKLKMQIDFEYSQGGESPVLKSIHQALYEKSTSSGLDMVFETHTTFHSFSFQKNQ